MAKLQKGVNDLKTWCLANGEFGQQLMQEWTGICEDGKYYKIDEISFGSNKKFKWKCNKGHEWLSDVNHRKIGRRCPYCYNAERSDKVSQAILRKGANDLKTWCSNNGEWGQQLTQEWTGECDDGRRYKIDEISFGSNKKFKWKCSKGHEWVSNAVNRINGSRCPYCSNATRGDKISQSKLHPGINDLKTWCLEHGEFGEQLLKEWTGQCEDGKHYEIDEVAKASNKKFKWKCSKGHEWVSNAVNRINGRHCPHCCTYGTSYPEQFICRCLEQLYPSTVNRCRVLKSPQDPQGIEFDIGIPEIPLCIEYSPTAWHKDKQERDHYKKELCEKVDVRLIQIIEDSYGELEPRMENNYICFRMDPSIQDEILANIVDHILKSLGHSIDKINLELAKKNALKYSRGHIEYEKALAGTHPELTKEWHPTLNGDLKPDCVTYGSAAKVYWKCQICNHGENGEWQSPPNRRTAKGYETGCPRCGYNWFKAQQGLPQKYKGLYSYLNDQENP